VPTNKRSPSSVALSVLSSGSVEVQGRMPWSSNGTYLVTVTGEDTPPMVAVYKPGRAERPLWDFPDGLFRREVAAYELSEALGWGFVPPTLERSDGPLGPGSLQMFVDADFEQHYFTLMEDDRHHRVLKRMATFDFLANNADRKGGHCLLDADGRIWAIDHGLCFHAQPKLRTVIWDFAGEELCPDDSADIERLVAAGLPESLRRILHQDELRALEARAQVLIRQGRLPEPRRDHPYPWPLV
jgi:uncharacterized repeat protein (TIGR03843 family)